MMEMEGTHLRQMLMRKTEVEIYCDDTNRGIVRMPNRKFPGCVVQGDSLSVLYLAAKKIRGLAAKSDDAELRSESRKLFDCLDGMIRHYEVVLGEHGLPTPYGPDVVLNDILDWQKKE